MVPCLQPDGLGKQVPTCFRDRQFPRPKTQPNRQRHSLSRGNAKHEKCVFKGVLQDLKNQTGGTAVGFYSPRIKQSGCRKIFQEGRKNSPEIE
jgi:hypothetical protein